MTKLGLLRVFGNLCCVCGTCLLIVFDPLFNVVEHRHEFYSSFQITRVPRIPRMFEFISRFGPLCDLKNVSMELHGSARDVALVHECRRVPYLREFCRPCLVCSGVVVSHTKQVKDSCTCVLNRVPTGGSNKINHSRILFAP